MLSLLYKWVFAKFLFCVNASIESETKTGLTSSDSDEDGGAV